MVVFPNCKINLGLLVKGKRVDGYHNLETVFYPVDWADALEIVPATAFKFETLGIHIPGDPAQNIVVKAYKLMQQKHGLPPVHIVLQKQLPVGSGLGGGSANAAFTIKALNSMFELNLEASEMKAIAASLGADCPFFIDNQPVFASGIGDVFKSINLNLSNYQVIVVYPRKAINTAWAFTQLKFEETELPSPETVIQQPITTWKTTLRNDFEREVVKVLPEVKSLKETFYKEGAIYASMSGSGSSVYGVFDQSVDLESIKLKVNNKGYKIYSGNLK